MVEDAAEGEDELMEKYLENGSLTDAEMVRGLEDVVYAGQFVPVFCAAGAREIGIIAWHKPLWQQGIQSFFFFLCGSPLQYRLK